MCNPSLRLLLWSEPTGHSIRCACQVRLCRTKSSNATLKSHRRASRVGGPNRKGGRAAGEALVRLIACLAAESLAYFRSGKSNLTSFCRGPCPIKDFVIHPIRAHVPQHHRQRLCPRRRWLRDRLVLPPATRRPYAPRQRLIRIARYTDLSHCGASRYLIRRSPHPTCGSGPGRQAFVLKTYPRDRAYRG